MANNKNKNPTLSAEEAALADQIFNSQDDVSTVSDEVGVVKPVSTPQVPTSTSLSMGKPKEDTITIGVDQFKELMTRLGDLENRALSSSTETKDIFNPLAEVKSDHVVRVAFHGDLLVVGYKEKQRPDGKKTFTWLAKDQESGEIRTFVTLLLRDTKTGEITEETTDYVRFIEQAVTLEGTIKKRTDVGKLLEQGLVNQMSWNGRTLVPTSERVMTGAKEQKFIFEIAIPGISEPIEMPENVINIKS